MLSPELIQTLQSLSQDDKQKAIEVLTVSLKQEDLSENRKMTFQEATERAFTKYKEAFEDLAKGAP
jgi:hypothetical protein